MALVPRSVRAAGASAAIKSLDIVEGQVLVEMEDGVGEMFHLHILHHRISAGVWITSDPFGTLQLDDLSDLEVVPVTRAAPLPMAGRPFLLPPEYTDEQLRGLRARAKQFALMHGWVDPGAAAAIGAAAPAGGSPDGWFYSDTAIDQFGQEVSSSVLTDATAFHMEGSVGLFKVDFADGEGPVWTTGQRVLRDDVTEWLAAKRSGSGRDRRLLPQDLKEEKKSVLVREAVRECDTAAVPDPMVFSGPAAIKEVVKSVESSGLEFQGWATQYLSTSGLSPKSGLAIEFVQAAYTLYFLLCVDLLDVCHLRAAEHIARRVLQIQKAVRRSPKNPDFEGLDAYSQHLVDSTGSVYAPEFDKHVANEMKSTALTLKQDRLNREEKEAEATRRAKNKNKGKDDG